MLSLRFSILLPTMLAVAACVSTPSTPPAPPPPPPAAQALPAPEAKLTILISIDGFRPDYLERGETPVMKALAESGAVGAMHPSFPSKTFPNHYTLVTGLRPDHNGMINNTMEDPAMPGVTFKLSDPKVASDPVWWEQGKPIWVSAEEQGVKTATMFWPGSDFAIHGVRPSDYAKFDQRLPDFARVGQLLSWLAVPDDERPGFATLYFDIVDTAGHMYGPGSPKTTSATAQVDAAIARLIDGLAELGIADSTNIVIVSDHGMGPVSDDQIIALDSMIARDKIHLVFNGPFTGLSAEPGFEAEVEAALIGHKNHGTCWKKEDLPARYDYGSNPRVPGIICVADMGWRYETEDMKVWRNSGGDHGFDPDDPLMNAIFIASGPSITDGVELETFDNVDVYPLLAELIGIEPAPNDGNLDDVSAALK